MNTRHHTTLRHNWYCCSTFHSHSRVFNNELNSYTKMIVKLSVNCFPLESHGDHPFCCNLVPFSPLNSSISRSPNYHYPSSYNLQNLKEIRHYKTDLKSLSVPCCRSVVFSGYSGFLHQKNWPPRYQ